MKQSKIDTLKKLEQAQNSPNNQENKQNREFGHLFLRVSRKLTLRGQPT
jgi:hypothetical protein